MTRPQRDAALAALPKETLVAMLGEVHDLFYTDRADELDEDAEWDMEKLQFVADVFARNGITFDALTD